MFFLSRSKATVTDSVFKNNNAAVAGWCKRVDPSLFSSGRGQYAHILGFVLGIGGMPALTRPVAQPVGSRLWTRQLHVQETVSSKWF